MLGQHRFGRGQVLWREPEPLGPDCDLAVRPVDVKGSTTCGPGDPFESYWTALVELASRDTAGDSIIAENEALRAAATKTVGATG